MDASMKKISKPTNNPGKILDKQTEDESYKRYKKVQYGYLILKALLSFFFGLLVMFLLKL